MRLTLIFDFASLSFNKPFSSHGSLIDESPIVIIARSVCWLLSVDFLERPTDISKEDFPYITLLLL